MVSISTFTTLALSFSKTIEQPHFEKKSFRIGKKIFATLDIVHHRATVKLSEIDQSVFCAFDKTIIYPVANKWGNKGWTIIELKKIPKQMCVDILATAYHEVLGEG